MSNIKKVLSLMLAAAMMLGMMLVPTSAAQFKDANEITYNEEVAIAAGLRKDRTVGYLAKKVGKPVDEVEKIAKHLAWIGVFRCTYDKKLGEDVYFMQIFAPGIMEMLVNNQELLDTQALLPEGADSVTIFVNPRAKTRTDLTACVSFDSGATWSHTKLIWKADCAYIELGDPGVPHAVLEIPGLRWEDRDALREQAKSLRYDPAFPKGANVNLYAWLDKTSIRILTYERGVENFTLACGTGSSALASILWKRKRFNRRNSINLEHRL